MRIAVTGKSGQLATSLVERASAAGHEVVTLGRPELELEDPNSILAAVETAEPDAIVSAAAYTAVDKAESESGLAHAVNGAGAGTVAQAAKTLNIPLVHVSTDYVFDGRLDRPYRETDATSPASVYGASKLAGEKAVLAAHPTGAAVIRVAWVYSPFGANFVKTMLRLANDRDELSVVADQVGNPTSALDIADGLVTVLTNLASAPDADLRGVFHMTAAGEASWADFAETIFAQSAAKGGATAAVKRITTAEFPTAARRPPNSRLDCGKIARSHGIRLPEWHGALESVISRLYGS